MDAKNIGSNFDEFLAEEAILDECNALAMKRVIALWESAKPSTRRTPPPALLGMGIEQGDIFSSVPDSDWVDKWSASD